MKLREIAERLECRLDGDGEIDIHRVAGIEEAGPGDLMGALGQLGQIIARNPGGAPPPPNPGG